jgi:hypothetical protein
MSYFQQVTNIYIYIYGIKDVVFNNKRLKNTLKQTNKKKDKDKLPQGIQNKLS